MAMRYKMNSRRSKKLFTRTASKVKSRNLYTSPMRGGYRL